MLEYKDQDDVYVDKFAERSEAKKDRIAKNEMQRLRNISDRRTIAERSTSFAGKKAVVGELREALGISKTSTASAGKFDTQLNKFSDIRREADIWEYAHAIFSALLSCPCFHPLLSPRRP